MKAVYKRYLKTVALIWAGCLVLFVLVYVFVLAPQASSIKRIQKQLAEKKRLYESAKEATQAKAKATINEQIEQLENKLGHLAVSYDDSSNLTFDIGQIAKEKDVTSFSIKNAETGRGSADKLKCDYIDESHFNVRFLGGFTQFATLLNSLERNRPAVFVDKFAIIRSDTSNSEHSVMMNLAVFVKKQKDS